MIPSLHFGIEMASHINDAEEAHRMLDHALTTLNPTKEIAGYMVISLISEDFLPGVQHHSSEVPVFAREKVATKALRSPVRKR
jgi:hypothetical protein